MKKELADYLNAETEKLKAEQRRENYQRFFKAMADWQRGQGNNCTVCWNNNHNVECGACGWWGKVPPEGVKVSIPGPSLKDFLPV